MSTYQTVPTRISILPDGTAFSRFVMCLADSDGQSYRAITAAEALRDSPQVAAALKALYSPSPETKAATAAGTTSDATWASPLAQFGISQEVLAISRGMSIVGGAEPLMFRVPPRTTVPVETTSAAQGAWIAEGAPTPVSSLSFNSTSLGLFKFQTAVVLTRELLRVGHLPSERAVRTILLGGLAASLDQQFLLPTVAAVTNQNPASITNAAVSVASTGSTATAIATDLASMISGITTAGGALRWVMRPSTAATIALRLGSVGTPTDLPRTLFGIPTIISGNSPQQVTLADFSQVLYADEGGFDVGVSGETALQMDTAPTATSTAATVMVDLFSRNLVAIRVTRWVSWSRAVDGSVVYMATAY
jgi:Phage capsid family